VINRRTKKNRWLFVVVTCATLAAGASLAKESGGKSGELSSSQKGLPAHASESDGRADKSSKEGQNSGLTGNRSNGGATTVRAPTTANGRAASGRAGGKAIGATGGIDLIRPDDGYSSLRRGAARPSPIATGQNKSSSIVSPVTVVPHQRSPAPASVEPVRNSAGVAIPRATSGLGKTDSAHSVLGVPVGMVISKAHMTATAQVTGINGTNMGHGTGGIGGPAKDISGINGSAFRSGINGSAFRHKF
jgi:hypothetical protein